MKPQTWEIFLDSERTKPYYVKLMNRIALDYQTNTVFPAQTNLFKAFELTPFETISVVIIGQDPYHNDLEAHGLAFSCQLAKHPPSLVNIIKEVALEYGCKKPSGDLTTWAKQGVFLLNTVLTVIKNKPRSHAHLGWEELTSSAIKKISKELEHVVFLLWGKDAHAFEAIIDQSKHLVLKTSHPSPLSSYLGFIGCRHFLTANEYLRSHGINEIRWTE